MTTVDDAIRSSLLPFAMKAYAQLHPGQRLEPFPYMHLIAEQLEHVAAGDCKRLVVTLPPRHAKTFLCAISLAAWTLAHEPTKKILLLSYGQELADTTAFECREILQAPWFRRLFKTRLAKSKLKDIVTTDGGGLRSVSIEGGVTGLGADLIIVDDPVEIKDSANIRQLERINGLFDSLIRTRLSNPKRGAIVVVAHRLAENDLPGHVLGQGGWKKMRLPLIAPRSRTYQTASGFYWRREKGELLRPDAFSARDIQQLRHAEQPDFETLQQQTPGGQDRLRIVAEDFGTFTQAENPVDPVVVLSIDPGQIGGPSHSFGVIQAWAPLESRHLLLDQAREQARYKDFKAEVLRFIRRYRPSVILLEATGQGPALLSDLRPQIGMQIVQITPVDDKVTRLRRQQKSVRAGMVLLPEHAPWRQQFVDEVTLFPYAVFDDQVDALSQYLSWIARNPTPPRRPSRAIAAGVTAHGALTTTGLRRPTLEVSGAVFVRRRS
jgi:predicted phage terminase large subunit-like protein